MGGRKGTCPQVLRTWPMVSRRSDNGFATSESAEFISSASFFLAVADVLCRGLRNTSCKAFEVGCTKFYCCS